ncbi:MAG: HEAT repeat domain-containing protein [Chloroflexota bacterium]|nr:HEAT repeat domain-containing protein [Chloroflexota bacterium]
MTALLQNNSWHFDPRSALIGAAAASLLIFLLYRNRVALYERAQRAWQPAANALARLRSSTEEKYLTALQKALRARLLFNPQDPAAIFTPPTFLAPPPLPGGAGDLADPPPPPSITFEALLKGHSRLLLTGPQGSGRTMALAMTVWQVAVQDEKTRRPYQRFPLWLDLSRPFTLPDTESDPLEFLSDLACQFLPKLNPKWARRHLRTQPALLLLDNWDALPPTKRAAMARLIETAAQQMPDSSWLIASAPEGYGPLVEADFVPLEIVPTTGEETLRKIYTGWAGMLGQEDSDLHGEMLYTLLWAKDAGDGLLEMTARTVLQLRADQIPYRPIEVLTALLEELYLPIPDLGEEQVSVAAAAQEAALATLGQLARAAWLEDRTFSDQELQELLTAQIPPKEECPPKLAGAARKLLQHSGLFQHVGKELRFTHYVWEAFFIARALAEEAKTAAAPTSELLGCLHDPTWTLLLDCYAGLGDMEPLIKILLRESRAEKGLPALLKAARWTVLAPEDAPWRKEVLKALAQAFIKPSLEPPARLRVGRALALVAGESSRPFYLQTLRHPLPAVRAAALRGLGWTGRPREMKILAAALRDPDFTIRESAIWALSDLGTVGAFRYLSELLPYGDEQLMLVIAEALATQPDGWDSLKEATLAEDLLVRRAAAHGLGQIHQPWAQSILEKIGREDTQWLVRSAAQAALSTQQKEAEDTVVAAPPKIDELPWLLTWAAQQGLGLGIGEAALQMLLHAVETGDSNTRILGALTLSLIGRQEHLDVLRPLLDHEDAAVQKAAAEAIRHIETRYTNVEEPPPAEEEGYQEEVPPAEPAIQP